MSERVFIAVNLPAEVKGKIYERLCSKINAEKCKVVERENLHITMLFLGYLHNEKIEEVKEQLGKLEFGKFSARLSGIGDFNSRVIWLGVKEGGNELREIDKKISELVCISEERFHPHVTLARNKRMGRSEVSGLLEKLNNENYEESVPIESVDLMLSVLKKSGPEYSVLFKRLLC